MVHVDASLIRADVSWESLAVRHVEAVSRENEAPEDEAEKVSRKTGKYKKVSVTDPDATMATTARNRRLEPAYKQHAVVDDVRGVILDVEVTTGELNEGQVVVERIDATMATTGLPITTVTADAGYAYAKVYGALERRGIDALIPTKAEPIRSAVPLRRFRYDAKNDVVKCPRGKILRPARPIKHGRFFYSRAKDCARCPLAAACLSRGRVNKAVVISDHYPALLRARRRRERWSAEDRRLYQRHRWRSEGFHGEAKTWHGLARAVRRGLQNMRIQAFLTAAAVNLKRLAAALLAFLLALWSRITASRARLGCFLPADWDPIRCETDARPASNLAPSKAELLQQPHPAALHRHVVPQAGERRLEALAAIDDHQLGLGQAARQQIVEHGPPSGLALTAQVLDGEHHLLAVAADAERDQERDGRGLGSSRTLTTVPSRISRTMPSPARSRFCQASQAERVLCHARLTTSLPMRPANRSANADAPGGCSSRRDRPRRSAASARRLRRR